MVMDLLKAGLLDRVAEERLPRCAWESSERPPDPTPWDLTSVVHVWRAFLNADGSSLDRYTATLSVEEHRRARRYHFDRDRSDFVTGRGLLRRLLGRYLQVAPEQVRFLYGEHGKPALAPEHGTALRFNVSHSDRVLLCAVTADREVGVDVERVRPLPDMDEVAACVFTARERAVLRRLPGPERQKAFFRCWTRKEAYIKAGGDGFALPVQQIEASLEPGEPARLLHVDGAPDEAGRWCLRELRPAPGYVGAVALRGHGWRVKCWNWAAEGSPTALTRVVEEAR
jgi:4'-phosphopantetheinyl transferase